MDTDIVEIRLTKEELRIFGLGFAGGIALMALSGDFDSNDLKELQNTCEKIKEKIKNALEPCCCSIHGTHNCPAHKDQLNGN